MLLLLLLFSLLLQCFFACCAGRSSSSSLSSPLLLTEAFRHPAPPLSLLAVSRAHHHRYPAPSIPSHSLSLQANSLPSPRLPSPPPSLFAMDLIQSLVRPSEAVALVQFKSKYGSTKRGGATAGQLDENLQYCYDSLFKTSRSFAMVIADLGDDLRDAVRTTLATTQPTQPTAAAAAALRLRVIYAVAIDRAFRIARSCINDLAPCRCSRMTRSASST